MSRAMLVLVAAALLLAACMPEPNDGEATVTPEWHWRDCVTLAWTTACRVEFSDGTRCVILEAYRVGGLDCEFPR